MQVMSERAEVYFDSGRIREWTHRVLMCLSEKESHTHLGLLHQVGPIEAEGGSLAGQVATDGVDITELDGTVGRSENISDMDENGPPPTRRSSTQWFLDSDLHLIPNLISDADRQTLHFISQVKQTQEKFAGKQFIGINLFLLAPPKQPTPVPGWAQTTTISLVFFIVPQRNSTADIVAW